MTDDDDLTPTRAPIGHEANRELLTVIGGYMSEANTHAARIDQIYHSLQDLRWPASDTWADKLLQEIERHHEKDAEIIASFRAFRGK